MSDTLAVIKCSDLENITCQKLCKRYPFKRGLKKREREKKYTNNKSAVRNSEVNCHNNSIKYYLHPETIGKRPYSCRSMPDIVLVRESKLER